MLDTSFALQIIRSALPTHSSALLVLQIKQEVTGGNTKHTEMGKRQAQYMADNTLLPTPATCFLPCKYNPLIRLLVQGCKYFH